MSQTRILCFVADATNVHVKRWLGYFVHRGYRVYCLSPEGGQIDGASVLSPSSTEPLSRWIHAQIKHIRPDIVHVLRLDEPSWAAARSGATAPLLVSLMGVNQISKPGQTAWQALCRHLRNGLTLRQCDMVTVVSEALGRQAEAWALGSLPVELIPIGTDPKLFHPDIDASALAERLNIPEDSFVVLSPRRMMPHYNPDTIIESIPHVLDELPQAIFVMKDTFAGTPERQAYVQTLKAQADALNVSHAIRWVEEVPFSELPAYYALADAVVSVPDRDGMPVTIFEAMACQKPLIVSDLQAYNEVIIHGQTGLRVPVHNSQVLARAITKIHKNPALARRMVEESQVVLCQYGIFDDQMMRLERYYLGLLHQDIPGKNPWQKRLYRWLLRLLPSPG